MKKTLLWILVAVIATAAVTAISMFYFLQHQSAESAGRAPGPAVRNGVVQDNSGKEVKYWYDPMAPEQKFEKPGKSPFMDMQLIPKYADEGDGESGVSIPASTQQNLGIRLETVARSSMGNEFAAVGRVEPDERAYYAVQTRTPGFVERLLIRAVGDPVRKNQKVAEIYAPDLLAAQREYLALLDVEQVEGIAEVREGAKARLKLLGMSDGEIARITQTRQAAPRVGVYAPAGGVVAELGVREGAQLMAGGTLMQISDLSKVWLIAEVPEQDAAKVAQGASVSVELQGGGEALKGKVGYLYPVLDETVRALRVRIELPNAKGMLRPGMYANVRFGQNLRDALTVPSESVIATGKRTVVIVKDEHGFRPAEVATGEEWGGRTEIRHGLEEGEQVVVSGQFLIDSEASLSGVLARLAQQPDTNHEMDTQAPARYKFLKSTGKVAEIDLKAGEITLSHAPIPELGWPAMTMGFKVRDAGQLKDLQKGDSVGFDLKSDASGEEYFIENIRKDATGAAR